MVLLAELIVRHTRRHMPTRRVALERAYLPTSGPAHGAALLAAVMATNLPRGRRRRARAAPSGCSTTRAAASRSRASRSGTGSRRDMHGLDRSRHRLLGEDGQLVMELDVHGAPGSAGARRGAGRGVAARRRAARSRSTRSRRVVNGRWNGSRPTSSCGSSRPTCGTTSGRRSAASGEWQPGGPADEEGWQGVAADQRWAMEVLGLRAGMEVDRDDVNRRFRRLLRDAHPDSGGAAGAAAARASPSSPKPARSCSIVASSEVAAGG